MWYSATNASFETAMNANFDDGVSLLRMFQQSDQKTMLVVFNYSPYLRSFLYAQQLQYDNCYNLFDDIQNLSQQAQQKIAITDFGFPKGVELYYTPYLINAYLNGNLYAQVKFTHWSDVCAITYFENDKKTYQHVLDDRGFISSVIVYQNGQEHYQDYLDNTGTWVMREYLHEDNKSVHIHPQHLPKFSKSVYKDMSELVSEKIRSFLKNMVSSRSNDNNIFVVSANEQHNAFFEQVKDKAIVIFSLFGNRYPLDNAQQLEKLLSGTPFFVIDSIQRLHKQSEVLNQIKMPSFFEMPPYNTQLKLGHSQRKKEQIIYINFDSVPENLLFDVLYRVFELMFENEWYDLIIGTNHDSYGKLDDMKNAVQDILAHHSQWQERLIIVNKDNNPTDITIGDDEPPRPRIDLIINHNELELIANLKYVRVVVDLGVPADVLTQITALSVGIPQINLYESPYVKHLENGYILDGIEALQDAIGYYFNHLHHWNESLVHTVTRMEAYASGEIVDFWVNAIHELEMNNEEN